MDLEPREQLLVQMIQLAERTGWTLEYIEGLDFPKWYEIQGVLGGLDSARDAMRSAGPKPFGRD